MARLDPFKNELPSKMKEVFENAEYLSAIQSKNLDAAKMIAINIINQSGIKADDKLLIVQTIEAQPDVATLQKYVYNSYLKHIGLGVVGNKDHLLKKLAVMADDLDGKGLKTEADQIDEFIRMAAMADEEEEEKKKEEKRKEEDDERLEGIRPYFRQYVDRLSSLTKDLEDKGLVNEANVIKSILIR